MIQSTMILVIFLAIVHQALGQSNFEDAFVWYSTDGVDLTSINTTVAWENWKARFGKSYANATENEMRKAIWLSNWNDINEHNKQSSKTHSERLHQYSDLSSDEFQDTVLGLNASNVVTGDEYVATGATVPDSIDWRNYNGKSYVTPVKNQGHCSSCWAFATTGVIESISSIASSGTTLTSLSEQELVSCYKGSCGGDTYFGAMNWVKTNDGLCSETAYPYTSGGGTVATCNLNCGTKFDDITGYTTVALYDEEALKAAVAEGPVAVAVDANPPFKNYAGGILTANCGISWNHAVLAVGYGSVANVDYWIIKNSWGTAWGESGYIKICRNCNKNIVDGKNYGQCGILGYPAGVPNLSATSVAKGCVDQSNEVEVITDKIYGCKGTFAGGVNAGSRLCTDGYSICSSDTQASGLGLTYDICSSTSIFTSTTEFYATLQSSQGNAVCTETGANDIWGCSNPGVSNLYQTPCGNLKWRIGSNIINPPQYWGWSSTITESSTTTLSNIAGGGVLCCKEGIGCQDASNEIEVVTDKIYACAGAFSGGMNNGGAGQLCAKGYEICPSASMANNLGLTADLCSSTTIFPTVDAFYGSAQSSNGDFNCAGAGFNDIWGCANPSSTNMYTGHACVNMQYVIGNQIRPSGWNWDSWTTESSTASLSKASSGGVLCCSVEERLQVNSTEYHSQCNDSDSNDNESKSYSLPFICAEICVVLTCFVTLLY
eukprot:264412_1